MKTVKVQIAKVGNTYNAMIDGMDNIIASGDTMEQIRDNIHQCIDLYLETAETAPEELEGEYNIEYYLNLQSFLEFYKGIFSKSGLEHLTGINQKQLWHYASGNRKPRKEQCDRFEAAIHRLGEELISFHF